MPLPQPKKSSHLYERYYDSKLPVVSEYLIANCPPLINFLQRSLKDEPSYKHKIIENADDFVAFRRITSNISQVVRYLRFVQ